MNHQRVGRVAPKLQSGGQQTAREHRSVGRVQVLECGVRIAAGHERSLSALSHAAWILTHRADMIDAAADAGALRVTGELVGVAAAGTSAPRSASWKVERRPNEAGAAGGHAVAV